MNTTHLIGSEQVERAGYNIESAAETISRAADTIDSAAHRMAGQLETHGYQLEALIEAMASQPTLHDYFAAHASEADISAHSSGPIVDNIVDEGFGHKRVERSPLVRSREQAKFAYATAMMKAREA